MDTRTRTASPSADYKVSQPTPPLVQDKISAYYSLVFPHFTFYIQTLSITVGRRCATNLNAATSSTAEQNTVDVDLGALKSVSRLHAKIEYDQDEDRFVLVVIGRNGAWVDGVWSGAGTRAPLGERSQIQIASRTFHFVLPPPPPPEDTPSPSSQSSANRPRSPSVDITSISPPSSQPSNSPPLEVKPLAPSPEPLMQPHPKLPSLELPNSNSIGKSSKANAKKRKKGDADSPPMLERPKPEDMPPKPPFTYAQLIYRAIKHLGGKATLQEVCTWISNTHEYYRYADSAWMSSVRHNLSSGRAFTKMERCGGDRGKGFFWSIDTNYSRTLEDQEIKSQQAAQTTVSSGKEGSAKPSRKKDKGALLEPPLKRSIKGDSKGTPLPPPLTSTPLSFKTTPPTPSSSVQLNPASPTHTNSAITTTAPATTGVFAYPSHPHHSIPNLATNGSSAYPVASTSSVNPYAALTQWNLHPAAANPVTGTPATSSTNLASLQSTASSSAPSSTSPPLEPQLSTNSAASIQQTPGQTAVPDVVIPIILGSIPATHPDYAPNHPNNSAKEGYMVLHERTLILDPDVFSGLTKENLIELEKMGARAALVVLTGHMVKALKEKRAKERSKERGNRRPKGAGGRGGGRKRLPVTGGPFTSVPLESRRAEGGPTMIAASGILSGLAPTAPTTPSSIHAPASTTPLPNAIIADPGSPLIVVDDSDDEGPTVKRRRLDDGLSAVNLSAT